MATSHFKIAEGNGNNIASHDITEDGEVKKLQRTVPSDSAGAEIFGSQSSAAQTDATQTASLLAFIKGIVKILADIWDSTNHFIKVSQATLLAGEDLTNNVLKVEQRFSGTVITSDTAVKSGSGFLHALTFSCNDAAPTAGSIIVYDNTAESGTQLFNHTFTTTPFVPFTVTLDVSFATGLYIGFTTTNDVNVTPSYR